jgi:hypothetical protein
MAGNPSTSLLTISAAFPRRGARVSILLAGVVLLSLGDLILTMWHLQSIGMVEANPVAAMILERAGSVWPLVLYKAATVAVCVGVLFRIRQRFQAEVGAWLCLLVLAVLSVHWHRYSNTIMQPDVLGAIAGGNVDERWITLAEE